MNIPYGYVYRIRNKINGKTYVGQRKLSLDKRWRQYMGSGVAVKAAIAKYGVDSFTKELVAYASAYDELNKIEVKLILEERAAGKAECNLHIGSPVPYDPTQPFKNLTPEEKKAVFASIAEQTRERARLRYEEAVRGKEETMLSLYAEYKSCKKVADHLGTSRKYVNRFLKESGITLNYQAVKGRVLDNELKKRISEGIKNSSVMFELECHECQSMFESKIVLRKNCFECSPVQVVSVIVCIQCNQKFETTRAEAKFCSKSCSTDANRKPLPPIETVKALYWDEKLSANEIGRRFGLSGQTIRNYMKRNDVDRREERHQS